MEIEKQQKEEMQIDEERKLNREQEGVYSSNEKTDGPAQEQELTALRGCAPLGGDVNQTESTLLHYTTLHYTTLHYTKQQTSVGHGRDRPSPIRKVRTLVHQKPGRRQRKRKKPVRTPTTHTTGREQKFPSAKARVHCGRFGFLSMIGQKEKMVCSLCCWASPNITGVPHIFYNTPDCYSAQCSAQLEPKHNKKSPKLGVAGFGEFLCCKTLTTWKKVSGSRDKNIWDRQEQGGTKKKLCVPIQK